MLEKTAIDIYKLVLDGTFKKFPLYFWTMPENYKYTIDCTKYLIEEILKWDREDICTKLNAKVFFEYKLRGMLSLTCNNSPYFAVNLAYPDEFKPWELSCKPVNFWTKETSVLATKWLIEEKLKWTKEEICDKLTTEVFLENGLSGVFRSIKSESCYEILNLVYPNEYKKEDLKYYNKIRSY